jgi:hypothetical protein
MFIKEEPGAFAGRTTGESSIKGSLEVFSNNPSFSDEHVTNGEDKVGADVLQDTNATGGLEFGHLRSTERLCIISILGIGKMYRVQGIKVVKRGNFGGLKELQ